MTIGPGKHFVRYFVATKRYVNFVAIIEQDSWTKNPGPIGVTSTRRVRLSPAGTRTCPAARRRGGNIHLGPVRPRAAASWSVGRVTLLGDACHPMLPFVAQGAAQAIEDGVTLAAYLQKYDDIPEALAHYQTLRLPRTAHVQSLAANNKILLSFAG